MDEDYELPEAPVPEERLGNLLMLIFCFAVIIGLALPAWLIGSPWGWFAYAGAVFALFGCMELRQLNNILVRTLPALRLLLAETRQLREIQEGRNQGRRSRRRPYVTDADGQGDEVRGDV